MPNLYATRADLYRYGLPRGLLANPGRRCAAVLASSDTFELDGHGFETDVELVFRVEGSGSLPLPLVAGVTYYAIRVSDSLFKIAASAAGPAIDLTTNGTAVMVATPLPVDETIERYSRFADRCLPAHAVPLSEPIPVEIRALVAELSAKKLLLIRGQSSESMNEMEVGAMAQFKRMATGLPLRDGTATASTNLAHSEPLARSDPRGWGGGGTIP
jgi:hypothetical protein